MEMHVSTELSHGIESVKRIAPLHRRTEGPPHLLLRTNLREWSVPRAWKMLPAALAWCLLALQAVVPWTAAHYVTQDGPSHLYTALVVKDLVLHPHGLYASAYRLQPRLVANWSTSLLLGTLAPIFGAAHAEAALSTFCVLFGFACLTYLRRTVDPLTNFLVNTWFLWVGYYNFHLGMAGCALVTGFYLRYARDLNRKRAIALGLGLVVLFFTHVLPVALALMVIGLACVIEYIRERTPPRPALLAAVAPVLVLLGFFVTGRASRIAFQPEIGWAWSSFPLHVFASSRGRAGEEALLVPVMIALLAMGLLTVRHREWTTERLTLAAAALASFAGYLLAPDAAFTGGQIKIRLAWAVFFFGCPALLSGTRLRALRTPLSLYIACFMAANLTFTAQTLRKISSAVNVYAAAMEQIPEGSAVLRLYYKTQGTRERFGFDAIANDPLLHTDAWIAARRRLLDLTDYQALSRLFPITTGKQFTTGQQDWLWRVEDGESNGFGPLPDLIANLPVRPEYVVLVGDDGSEATRHSDFAKTQAWLDGNLLPVSGTGPEQPSQRPGIGADSGATGSSVVPVRTSQPDSFVRVYRQR
jgi:hypothetical protein